MSVGRSVAVLLLLVAAAGCTSPEQRAVDPPPPSARASVAPGGLVAGCEDAVAQEQDPGRTYRVAAGVVAVPSGDQVLEPLEQASGAGPARLFAKWGLLVRSGSTVELSLPPGWGDRARINWGDSGAEPATAITVTACTAGPGERPWSVFTGGTWVAEADCVPIRISTGTEQVTVELSIGAPCRRPGG
ncbi:hypothetical protein QLQ12_39695 [Actinoplanes sp. NEAU-A12]|uniref:Uncharacterized protein n=1 Tax=Actinoplanes sandaracinus TaxID=3045177 RepID=A0ABT6WYA6_9ACTN|nr:hypothetical protein [Actinoplanes sandaracinus]MDI6104732.1 hypothetical protein [Actinoplanes sandaracinus]